jgi:predicted enzyme related to lactoylglutathione lyase
VNRFGRYQLRTKDVGAARAFYAAVLGRTELEIVKLPEAAAARGAPPHGLGLIGVDDVERAASAFVARGAMRLGPGGGELAVLRDPGGAVVGIGGVAAALPDVVWHHLSTHDLPRATAAYGELFGWRFGAPVDLGTHGLFHEDGEASVSISDVTARPGIHPHWLFHFRVAALEPALEAARAAGAVVLPTVVWPGGERVAVCDDPQGAAFALRERA